METLRYEWRADDVGYELHMVPVPGAGCFRYGFAQDAGGGAIGFRMVLA